MSIDSVVSLEKSLSETIRPEYWTSLNHQCYQMVKDYAQYYQKKNRQYESTEDKRIIRGNLNEQDWFKHSKVKPVMSQLLDQMTLNHYSFDQNDFFINLMVIISFQTFNVNVCLYKNKVNHFTNYYISFTKPIPKLKNQTPAKSAKSAKSSRAYMAYFIEAMGTVPTENMKMVKLPELEKIYQITGLSPHDFNPSDLLCFFSEIILYYDDSEILGDLQIGNYVSISLNQIIERTQKQ